MIISPNIINKPLELCSVDVTVLLCTFNNEKYISESIDSILNQSFDNFELIIINDGSTDRSKDKILQFDDKRIKYIEYKHNIGLEKSKNIGIKHATGKYIAYMDGDDICHPDRIKTQYELMESNPDLIICGTLLKLFGNKSGTSINPAEDINLRLRLLIGVPFPHATAMINRNRLIDSGVEYRFGYKAAEDYIFFSEILKEGACHCIQKPLYYYRWHGKNTSVRKRDLQLRNHKKAQKQIIKQTLGIELNTRELLIFDMIVTPDFTKNYSTKEVFSLLNKITSEKKVKNDKLDNSIELMLAKNFFYYCLYISKKNPLNFKHIFDKNALVNISLFKKVVAFRALLSYFIKSKLLPNQDHFPNS